MKLKNFLKAFCLTAAALVPAMTVISCSNDSSGDDSTGYTPIRPTIIKVTSGARAGDVITIGSSGASFQSYILYDCSFTYANLPDGIDTSKLGNGKTSYEDSPNDAATKTMFMYIGTTVDTSSGSITSIYRESERSITIFFDSRNTGHILTDSWTADSTYSPLSYATGDTLYFE